MLLDAADAAAATYDQAWTPAFADSQPGGSAVTRPIWPSAGATEMKTKAPREAAAVRGGPNMPTIGGRVLGSGATVAASQPLPGAPTAPPVRIHASAWTCDGRLFLVSVSRALADNDAMNHTYHSRGAAESRPRVSRMDAAMARKRDPHIQVCFALRDWIVGRSITPSLRLRCGIRAGSCCMPSAGTRASCCNSRRTHETRAWC